jgi:hypothetical protein
MKILEVETGQTARVGFGAVACFLLDPWPPRLCCECPHFLWVGRRRGGLELFFLTINFALT